MSAVVSLRELNFAGKQERYVNLLSFGTTVFVSEYQA